MFVLVQVSICPHALGRIHRFTGIALFRMTAYPTTSLALSETLPVVWNLILVLPSPGIAHKCPWKCPEKEAVPFPTRSFRCLWPTCACYCLC
uniref:Uncharacterized protein n=1 Tax=Anguilla anguilla TaxID=7936 RepID=A0A0E9WIL0_ANGAN